MFCSLGLPEILPYISHHLSLPAGSYLAVPGHLMWQYLGGTQKRHEKSWEKSTTTTHYYMHLPLHKWSMQIYSAYCELRNKNPTTTSKYVFSGWGAFVAWAQIWFSTWENLDRSFQINMKGFHLWFELCSTQYSIVDLYLPMCFLVIKTCHLWYLQVRLAPLNSS